MLPEPRGARGRPPSRTLVQPGDRATLWRGARLMGAIHFIAPLGTGSVVGVLLPADDHPPLTNIDQQHGLGPRGVAVVQSELDSAGIPWPVPGAMPQRTPPRRFDADALAPISMSRPFSQPSDVPPERQLRVRDDDGHVLPASSILLTELRLVDGFTDPFRARAPEAAIHRTPVPGAPDRERLWYVVVEFDAERHAG